MSPEGRTQARAGQPNKATEVLYLTAGSGITPVMGMLRDIEFDDVAKGGTGDLLCTRVF
ncbi:hypothetical protein ACFQ61_05865 [Streptomyces sp. NPDC056500]|uniref:hypothetical protein n=1 Tax=Streptomyces sp. NPDC056500 TaxID=3345840 RepID=UPI0036B0B5A2